MAQAKSQSVGNHCKLLFKDALVHWGLLGTLLSLNLS